MIKNERGRRSRPLFLSETGEREIKIVGVHRGSGTKYGRASGAEDLREKRGKNMKNFRKNSKKILDKRDRFDYYMRVRA